MNATSIWAALSRILYGKGTGVQVAAGKRVSLSRTVIHPEQPGNEQVLQLTTWRSTSLTALLPPISDTVTVTVMSTVPDGFGAVHVAMEPTPVMLPPVHDHS